MYGKRFRIYIFSRYSGIKTPEDVSEIKPFSKNSGIKIPEDVSGIKTFSRNSGIKTPEDVSGIKTLLEVSDIMTTLDVRLSNILGKGQNIFGRSRVKTSLDVPGSKHPQGKNIFGRFRLKNILGRFKIKIGTFLGTHILGRFRDKTSLDSASGPWTLQDQNITRWLQTLQDQNILELFRIKTSLGDLGPKYLVFRSKNILGISDLQNISLLLKTKRKKEKKTLQPINFESDPRTIKQKKRRC
jgi:hypothetical protein